MTTYAGKINELKIHYGNELAVDDKMLSALKERTLEALNAKQGNDLTDTMLVVVGRGTSDANANSDVCKITRLLNKQLGFGWADTVYSGVTYPSVGAGLEMLMKLGFKRIVAVL